MNTKSSIDDIRRRFARLDVLHKNNCFAAFGGVRSRRKTEREGGTG